MRSSAPNLTAKQINLFFIPPFYSEPASSTTMKEKKEIEGSLV